MADIIHLLPDSVANKIAAGEVIQRPASVIKELVENSVDAGATDIAITIIDAGRTLIQITDNGKGMSPTDARLAFERHATSKISEAADLFALSTMGFRGEALPSICAISHLEILTCLHSDEMGTRIIIAGSKVEKQEACFCKKGTTILVKNLFYNVPARRRFLKSDNVELANIMREFERLALVNNNIRFHIDTGSRQRDLRPGSFKQRIADLWKGSLNIELLPVDIDTDIVKINGYISRPEHARRRNPLQFLIVNGRNMKNPYFHKAIINCFERLIAPETQPNYFLKFEVDPATIDVNIHPTKNEIEFENKHEIWSLLTSAVKAALGKFSAVPSIDFETGAIEVAPFNPAATFIPSESADAEEYNPFSDLPRTPSSNYSTNKVDIKNWDSLYVDFMQEAATSSHISQTSALIDESTVTTSDHSFHKCMQALGRYIVTTSSKGILIIDQHRAHMKVLYEEIINRTSHTRMPLQGVIFGEEIILDETQKVALEEVNDELIALGITLVPHGDSWVISTLPPLLSGKDGREIVLNILDSVNSDDPSFGAMLTDSSSLKEHVAIATARAAAIPRGRILSDDEMHHIVKSLFALKSPTIGPDGKPVMCIIDSDNLLKHFKAPFSKNC